MLSLAAIKKEALRVARKYIGARRVEKVLVEEDQDWEGKDSVRITIVLKSAIDFTGVKLGSISLDLVAYMVRNDDDRYPYTHYATIEELEEIDRDR